MFFLVAACDVVALHFAPVIDVELEKIEEENAKLRDRIEPFEDIEPWEYIDPDTGQKYETAPDENGCDKSVKEPHSGERFRRYILQR